MRLRPLEQQRLHLNFHFLAEVKASMCVETNVPTAQERPPANLDRPSIATTPAFLSPLSDECNELVFDQQNFLVTLQADG